ncbi:MAG TPA: hypothetical protein VNA11_18550 [Pseudonocardia sp.]|nr:hypothetical protein [Pseudonocardia sp.]
MISQENTKNAGESKPTMPELLDQRQILVELSKPISIHSKPPGLHQHEQLAICKRHLGREEVAQRPYADTIGYDDHEGYAARTLPDGTPTATWTYQTRHFLAYQACCACGWCGCREPCHGL